MKQIYLTCIFVFLYFILTFAQSPSTSNLSQPIKQITYKQNLAFIENKNQWDASIKYRVDLPSGFLFVKENSIQYSLYDYSAIHVDHFPPVQQVKKTLPEEKVRAHGVEVEFLSSQKGITWQTEGIRTEKRNYFTGSDPSRWASDIAAYDGVWKRQIYPGIDLHLVEEAGRFKYEFWVAPGTDVSQIKMRYSGAQSLEIKKGDLLIGTSLGTIIEKKPYSFQKKGEKLIPVNSSFKLEDNILSFEFPDGYDPQLHLVIDPVLIFSTYSGSTTDNWGSTATFDEAGNLYSAGIVLDIGNGFPTTLGAFQINFAGIIDVGILKFNPNGTALIYATYLGGANSEFPHSLIVNSKNELLIYGTTSSTNFPVRGSVFSPMFNGGVNTLVIGGVPFTNGSDIFISKLSPNGNQLLASTFVGGSGNDGIHTEINLGIKNYGDQFRGEIITDDNDFVYLASLTASANFPMVNAFDNTISGTFDGVLMKIQPDLSAIVWSTYVGGAGFDAVYSLKLNNAKEIYICGATTSNNLPGTTGALNPTARGNDDAYVAKWTNDGQLIRLTYLGSSAADQAFLLDLDVNGSVHVLGQTRGAYPVSRGVYKNDNSGQFIHKINGDLNQSIFSTVFGSGKGSPDISPTAFLVNDCGNIYVMGWGSQTGIGTPFGNTILSTQNLVTTPDAYSRNTDNNDFYILILEKDAQRLLYASFFGGATSNDHVDGGTSRFDKKGIIYHAVCASCGTSTSDFPTTPGSVSRIDRSLNCNNGAFKFDIDALVGDFRILDSTFLVEVKTACLPVSVNFVYDNAGGNTFTWDILGTKISNRSPVLFRFNQTGTFLIQLTIKNCLGDSVVVTKPITISQLNVEVTQTQTICKGNTIQLQASPGDAESYLWSPSAGLNNTRIANPLASPLETTIYTVTVRKNGCEVKNTVRVNVLPEIKADFELDVEGECGKPARLLLKNKSEGVDDFQWFINNGTVLSGRNPDPYYFDSSATYQITLRAYNQDCEARLTRSFFIENNFKAVSNVITPNNDGKNDFFILEERENYRLEIFNRWGNAVFRSDNYQNDWGGNVGTGTYYYVLTSPSGIKCKGWIQVMK